MEYLWIEFKESMKLDGRNIISLFSIASNLNFIPSIMNVAEVMALSVDTVIKLGLSWQKEMQSGGG